MIQIKEELPRIFAAYWGAEVTGFFNSEFVTGFLNSGFVDADFIKSASRAHQLLLKNLADISDEDAKEIAEMLGYDCSKWGQIRKAYIIGSTLKLIFENHVIKCSLCIPIIDFLRSKSYNCGYGIYSPQDLVDAGVVKIIQ